MLFFFHCEQLHSLIQPTGKTPRSRLPPRPGGRGQRAVSGCAPSHAPPRGEVPTSAAISPYVAVLPRGFPCCPVDTGVDRLPVAGDSREPERSTTWPVHYLRIGAGTGPGMPVVAKRTCESLSPLHQTWTCQSPSRHDPPLTSILRSPPGTACVALYYLFLHPDGQRRLHPFFKEPVLSQHQHPPSSGCVAPGRAPGAPD